jgi:uncharacterized repeat protein (TIGR02543 family)
MRELLRRVMVAVVVCAGVRGGLVQADEIPVISSISEQWLLVGVPFTYDVDASGDPATTYSLTSAPNGMVIDSVTGVISWTPSAAQEGSRSVTVRATNSAGSADARFTVNVMTVIPVTPVLDAIPNQTVRANTTWSYTLKATGTPAPDFYPNSIPFGMEFDVTTGVMTWKPAPWDAGEHTVVVSAGNIRGDDTQTFTITVLPALFTVQFSSTDGGSVTKPGEGTFTYEYGQRIDIEATPDPGHLFVEWTGSAVDSGNLTFLTRPSTDVVVTENCTVMANFKSTTGVSHTLTVSSTDGGNVTAPGEGVFSYVQGASVILLAAHDPDCDFICWTGSAVDAGKVASPADAYTTVTMDGDYTVRAVFQGSGTVSQCTLTIHATAGGDVPYPGTGMHKYYKGTAAGIRAHPMEGYRFRGWTGSAVNAGAVTSPTSADTTVTMNADYEITANFEIGGAVVQRTLTVSSGEGGCVLNPGEGAFQFDENATVSIQALADSGYRFTGWTGTAVTAGAVANPASHSTTVSMSADFTLMANFEPSSDPVIHRQLTLTSTDGGRVSTPGEGAFTYDDGQTVTLVAQADAGYQFSLWTGTAVDAGRVAGPLSANTRVTMDADYSLRANFVAAAQGSVSISVLTPNGGEDFTPGSTVAITWQVQGTAVSVSVELSIDGGSTWTQISQSSGRSCSWKVPAVSSNRCLIRVSAIDNMAVCDTSDAPFSIGTAASHIWYVDATAKGIRNGSSWADAFVYLQDAVSRATPGDSILVAEGLYRPDLGGGCKQGDRAAAFQLASGIGIFGGFPAGGGDWSVRNPTAHWSVLSGDLGVPDAASDNSYHVVVAHSVAKTAVLDGCVICDGYADGAELYDRGAGLYNLSGSPQIRNCMFLRNHAANGGGACNLGGSPLFVNCIFTANSAGKCGGGLYSQQGDAAVVNCTLTANQGLWRGGGVFNSVGTLTVANSILWGNGRQFKSSYDEWAQASGDSQPTIAYCCIQGWTGSFGGEGSFGDDPLFISMAGPDAIAGTLDDDLRLSKGSPCIDAGNALAVPSGIATDLEGKSRMINHVDVGAYEFDPEE